MVLLLQGRGYNLRRGVHFRDGGTSACSHEGGTVAVSLVFVSVFREAYDRTKPTEEGRASALRGRLQMQAAERGPDEAQQRACAPRRRARRGEPACALASAVASDEDWTRKKLRALYALCASGGVSVRLAFTSARRYFRGIPPSCQSRRGYRSPGYMLPPDGRGYDKQGGYIKPHIDGGYRPCSPRPWCSPAAHQR